MKVDAENKQEYYDWANGILDTNYSPSMCWCIASLGIDNKILAVIILYDRVADEHRCSIAFATDTNKRWATRNFGLGWTYYVFDVLDVHRLQFYTDNHLRESLGKKLGFELEARLTDWYGPDKPAALYVLLRPRLAETRLAEYVMSTINKEEV